MDVKQQFLKLLHQVKNELRWEHGVKQFQFFVLFASIYTVTIFLIARLFIVMYIIQYAAIGLCFLLTIYIYRSFRSHPNLKEAAQLYDYYAKEERTSTALSFINQTDAIYELQRKDALTFMKKSAPELKSRNRIFIYPIPLLLACVFFAITTLFVIFPNEKMLEAQEKKSEIKVVKEVKKDLQEKVKVEKNEIVKKSLEEAIKDLNSEQKAEDVLKALMKQNNELELKKIQSDQQSIIDQSIDQLRNINMDSLVKALEKGDKELLIQEINKIKEALPELSNEEKNALAQILGEGEELSEEQLVALEEKLLDMIDRLSEANSLEIAQNQILQSAKNLQQMMSDHGLKSTIDLDQLLADGNEQDGNGTPQTDGSNSSESGTGGDNSSANTPGDSSGSDQGDNQQSGSGSSPGGGSGNSPGSGSSIGSGGKSSSSGIGLGAGKGMGSRELTIPETTDGKVNIERDHGELGTGNPTEQAEGHGPILKGSVRPYEQVYNQYEKASRESVDRMHLPTELQNIVKDYFSKIKPD